MNCVTFKIEFHKLNILKNTVHVLPGTIHHLQPRFISPYIPPYNVKIYICLTVFLFKKIFQWEVKVTYSKLFSALRNMLAIQKYLIVLRMCGVLVLSEPGRKTRGLRIIIIFGGGRYWSNKHQKNTVTSKLNYMHTIMHEYAKYWAVYCYITGKTT